MNNRLFHLFKKRIIMYKEIGEAEGGLLEHEASVNQSVW